MKAVKQWLLDYGLNDKEAEVYLVIAESPDCKAIDIQRETMYVRTTIYYALNQLKAQGLISENVSNNVRTFRVNDSSVFRGHIEQIIQTERSRLETIDTIETYLASVRKAAAKESYVSRYEGVRSIKSAVEIAMRCNSKSWHVLAARDNFLAHMPKAYQKYYLTERERRGITAKTLWEPVDDGVAISLKDTALRAPRRLPDPFAGNFKSLVIVYDDTVLIIDPYKEKTAHAITSAATADLMRMMFMAIWSDAKNA